jgi:histidinol-phosphate/aromatic aminotransferase/cobyric acid decarboxylase-like protein/adenosyl cobinamide kinase/adenosyl cobinamide phosphate guanylyltransferase
MSLVLVVGGIRCGKSQVAERLAAASGAPVCYLATAPADDPEMSERIARHRRRRPPEWRTVSSDDPTHVVVGQGETLLVDGIGPWLARLLLAGGLWTDEAVAPLGAEGQASYQRAVETVRAFARTAAERSGLTVVVAEESGLGLVPQGAGARRYLDLAGEALQELAQPAERVLLVVAGRVTVLGDDHRVAGASLAPWPGPAAAAPPPEPAATASNRAGPGLAPGIGPGMRAELRLHGDQMVAGGQLDFAVNVVPGGPPEWLRDELAAALDHAAAYPDEGDAVAALAERHGRAPGEVLPTNGSAEAFWLLAAVLQPARAVVVHPTFTEPEAALRAAGRRVERAFRDPGDFALDPAAVPAGADLVILGNPNNPTGTLDPAEVVAGLARPGRLLVVDEAFMELVPGEPDSLAARADLPGLVVVRSLTKAWSLAGVRAGYLLAPAEVVAAARAARQPWSVNGPACAALAAWARRTSASGGAEATLIARRVAAARAELAASLACLPGVRVWPAAANFLLIQVPDGPAVHAGLARRGIAVRPARTFPGLTADHIRLAVRDPSENRRLVEALRALLLEPTQQPDPAAPAPPAAATPAARRAPASPGRPDRAASPADRSAPKGPP